MALLSTNSNPAGRHHTNKGVAIPMLCHTTLLRSGQA
jgi:hypothetical protein